MRTEDILVVEESGENCINLIRDKYFWQVWNKSAFLFHTHIKKYQPHKKYIKKISQDIAFIAFPSKVLPAIQKIAEEKGFIFSFKEESKDHIVISKVPQPSGYEQWWADVVKAKVSTKSNEISRSNNSEHRLLPAYKCAYDLCLHIYNTTEKMSRKLKYDLGVRVRGYATDLVENMHVMTTNIKLLSNENKISEYAAIAHKLRIDIRLLKDLEGINIKSWGHLNTQIEDFLNLLRAEFLTSTRNKKATHSQSSETLPPSNAPASI